MSDKKSPGTRAGFIVFHRPSRVVLPPLGIEVGDKESPADIIAAARARMVTAAAEVEATRVSLAMPPHEPPPVVVEPGCWNCRYHRGEECRFNPPVVGLGTPDGDPVATWPEVTDDDWCREHVELRPKQ